MQVNLPVTQKEHAYPESALIVSTTDPQGRITHCNNTFVEVSGYNYEELMGQPHSLVRHPDMPPEAFKDLWATIGRGRPWTGIVKNRRKNGDHYWVRAHVTAILEDGKPVAYMSVREHPTRVEIQAAEALYAKVAAERASGHHSVKLHAGRVRRVGLRDLPGRAHRLSLTSRLGLGMATTLALSFGSFQVLPQGGAPLAASMAVGGAAAILTWFHFSLQRKLDAAADYAEQLAGCNLTLKLQVEHPHPLSQLTRALAQIHVNLRAAISDARAEVAGTGAATAEIARGSQDLSKRTDEQTGALQKTVASMQHIATTVARTASTAGDVARQSDATAQAATEGGLAMGRVGSAIHAVEHSSRQVAEIVQLIQGIAFQTNILALNAAVEAARAGDQGRGFAVVASEVRGLASRSANAAKQVRELIHASVEQVADSTRQMGGANTAIGQTVAEVQRVGAMIRGITQAASDQAQDIAEINRAVTTLDQMTQANAALVQETAAAVEALHQRTETLQRTVQVFRL